MQAEANIAAAKLMRDAAALLESKAAMQLRYLDTIQKIGENKEVQIILQKSV